MTQQNEDSAPGRRAPRKARKVSPDTLATSEGVAIPIWRAGASDPVDYLASVMDELPGTRRFRRVTRQD